MSAHSFVLNLFFCRYTTRLLHHQCGWAWGGCVGVRRHRQHGLTQTCSPPHRNTHTPVNNLKHQMGTEHPTVSGRKEFSGRKVPNVVFFFYPVKSINLMLFIWEKQITGFHQQLCECIHVFSSGLSLLFPCQCVLAPDTATAKVSVCVFVCVCVWARVYVKRQQWSV